MSRIGKQIIEIPSGTNVNILNDTISVMGPHGELFRAFKSQDIGITVAGRRVTLLPVVHNLETKALWGTYASHIQNMIAGVNKPFQKQLIIEGVGFKSEVSDDTLIMSLGFSHPVKIKIPKDLKVTAEKNIITVLGPDIEKVGQFTAFIRAQKKPEPYKGKGIRYREEIIRRKEGKKSV